GGAEGPGEAGAAQDPGDRGRVRPGRAERGGDRRGGTGDGRRVVRDGPPAGEGGGDAVRHLVRGGGGGGGEGGPAAGERRQGDRRRPARPRRALPEHGAVPAGVNSQR